MNRSRLLSLVWALNGATQFYWLWARSVEYTDGVAVLVVACCVLPPPGGLAGVVDPDGFGVDYTPTWLLVTQVLALAGVAVGGFLVWGQTRSYGPSRVPSSRYASPPVSPLGRNGERKSWPSTLTHVPLERSLYAGKTIRSPSMAGASPRSQS